MSDCAMLGHPIVDGRECPCGEIVRKLPPPPIVKYDPNPVFEQTRPDRYLVRLHRPFRVSRARQ